MSRRPVLVRPVEPGDRPPLRDRDASRPRGVPHGQALEEATTELLARAADLQRSLYAEGTRAVLVILQARDTGGKDGTVKDVFGALNPAGCTITSFKTPTDAELRHDFLWRVHQAVPPHGMIGVFNRSHYEDVVVARVRGLVPPSVWKTRFRAINDFERLLATSGTAILKLFLHISQAEQRARLRARLDTPAKQWKFAPSDLDDRALWGEYAAAYREAIARCSPAVAPWYVIPADKKAVRNYLVAGLLVRTLTRLRPVVPVVDPALLAKFERLL